MCIRNPRNLWKLGFVVIAFLYIIDVFGTTITIPVRKAPDERHHFALVVFFVEHDLLEFNRREIKTDRYDVNHLAHPPFYYYLLAQAAKLVFPTLGPGFFSEETTLFEVQSVFWIKAFRVISIVIFTTIYLLGVYMCLRKIVHCNILTIPASLLLCVLWFFLSSRLMGAAVLSNDAMAIAVWPWLLYIVICGLYGFASLRKYYLVVAAVISSALMTKATLFPLGVTAAIVCFFAVMTVVKTAGTAIEPGNTSLTLRWQSLWAKWRSMFREIGFVYIAIGLAVALIPISAIIIDYSKYGSIAPAFYEVHPNIDPKSRLFNVELLNHPLSFLHIAENIIDKLWSSTIGVYGHGFYYITATGPISGQIYLGLTMVICIVSTIIYWRTRDKTWLLIALSSGVYIIFIAIFIIEMYSVHLTRGHFASQGRYTVGYFEMSLLSVVGITERLNYLSRRTGSLSWLLAGAAYTAILVLTLLLIRPWGLTGYSLLLADQDGRAAALLAKRVIPASAMTFESPAVKAKKIGLKAGRSGGYPDAEAVVLNSSSPRFSITVSLPVNLYQKLEGTAGEPRRCSEILISTNRSMRIRMEWADRTMALEPFEFATVPIQVLGSEFAARLHLSLNENVIEMLRHIRWPKSQIFVYGVLASTCPPASHSLRCDSTHGASLLNSCKYLAEGRSEPSS